MVMRREALRAAASAEANAVKIETPLIAWRKRPRPSGDAGLSAA